MRHIEKDQDNSIARKRLTTHNCNRDLTISVQNLKGNYSSARYGHSVVREELNLLYHGKCCYCEVVISPATPEQVEHYRPKSEISRVNSNGYYWLGNEWSNLMLICGTCNGKKSTKFPLNIEKYRVVNHPANTIHNLDMNQIPLSSGYLNKERPLIINPEYHHPEKLLFHNYTCQLVPIKNNKLAKTTIDEIGLNNDPLVIKKQGIVDDIIRRIEDQLVERYRKDNPLNDGQLKRQLNLIFNDIINRTHLSSEFSLLGMNMIERFDELILEDFESPFDSIIRDFFVDFLFNY